LRERREFVRVPEFCRSTEIKAKLQKDGGPEIIKNFKIFQLNEFYN